MTPMLGIMASGISGHLFPVASGGTEYTSGGYKYHKFTSSGTLTVSSGGALEALVIAGGGGGGYDIGGGGGAGGLLYSSLVVTTGSISVTVGAGGAGGTSDGTAPNGSNSVFRH